jgi:glucokinase
MNALGIHLTRSAARAVLVDDRGTVLGQALVEGGAPSEAAQAAAEKVRGSSKPPTIGLAVDLLDGLDTAAAAAALAALGEVRVVRAGSSAVVAEAWVGAAQGARHAVCLWIGDTVLAGLLLNGEPWAGSHGFAGSAAWLALNPVERQDYKKLGTLAAEVTSAGIAKRLAWRIQAGDGSAVLERAGSLDSITAAHVFEGARAGDGVSISVVREAARYIGMAIANLAAAIDPDVVVIAGPIVSAGDLVLEPVRQECARRLPPPMVGQFRCEMSPLGEYGVAIGAARLGSQPLPV